MAATASDKQTVSKVSEEIVSLLAAKAALGVPGVNRLNETIADNLTKKISGKGAPGKGIKISRHGKNSDALLIDIYLDVDYGAKIPDLAWEIQTAVRQSVESALSLPVKQVNIHVQGVSMPKKHLRKVKQKA